MMTARTVVRLALARRQWSRIDRYCAAWWRRHNTAVKIIVVGVAFALMQRWDYQDQLAQTQADAEAQRLESVRQSVNAELPDTVFVVNASSPREAMKKLMDIEQKAMEARGEIFQAQPYPAQKAAP